MSAIPAAPIRVGKGDEVAQIEAIMAIDEVDALAGAERVTLVVGKQIGAAVETGHRRWHQALVALKEAARYRGIGRSAAASCAQKRRDP